MSNYQNSAGTDLDNLFYTSNSNAGSLGYLDTNSVDLGNKYTNANTLGYATGYQNNSGTDIGYSRGNFNPSGSGLRLVVPGGYAFNDGMDGGCYGYYSDATCKTYGYDEDGRYCKEWNDDGVVRAVNQPTYWGSWYNSYASSTRSITGLNESWGRPTHSSHRYSMAVFAVSDNANYPVTNLTYTRAGFGRWHNSWCDIGVSVQTLNSQVRYIVLAPYSGAGGGVYAYFTITATFGNYGTKMCRVRIYQDNDSNKITTATSSSQLITSVTVDNITFTWHGPA